MNAQEHARRKLRLQVLDFIIHLRWHYQVFILSGCYLLGGLFHLGHPDWDIFTLQFLNVHLILFGGATAYNSFWDKDKGRIGGLKNPPAMSPWMRPASLALQFLGFLLSLPLGLIYSTAYFISAFMFWLYSSPAAKWKGRPWLSLVAIAVSTGTCSFIMGHIAIGGSLQPRLILPAAGCSLILLSLYPLSQIFQMQEDRERHYQTFAIRYGLKGIRAFFSVSYFIGLLPLSYALGWINPLPGKLFFAVSVAAGGLVWLQLRQIQGTETDYKRVMCIKYGVSMAFITFITFCFLILKGT